MKFLFTSLVAFGLLVPTFAQAEELSSSGNSCRAKSVERFYCPASGGNWWYGPYYDGGCSVKCEEGQRASCEEASCADDYSGDPVASSCSCN